MVGFSNTDDAYRFCTTFSTTRRSSAGERSAEPVRGTGEHQLPADNFLIPNPRPYSCP
jgi:hypothetical protein